jgi:hypothetical protein
VPQRQIYTSRTMKWLERLGAIKAFEGAR